MRAKSVRCAAGLVMLVNVRKRGSKMLNRVVLMGRLTKDVEIRYTEAAEPMAVARFTLAVDRDYKKQGEESVTDFISCVSFGKTAEFVGKYFAKGSLIAVEGRIQTGSYTNKDGNKVYTTDIKVENVHFTGEKRDGSQPQPAPDNGGFMEIPKDIENDLPFK